MACVHHLFEAQVAKTPESLAVIFGHQHLTYQALNARANQLAHHLHHLGVGTESLVGICMERSIEMLVGLLGILKAGAAYVPIDPTYPQERILFTLEDTGLSVLLTQKYLLEGKDYPVQAVCLDAGWETIAQYSPENPQTSVQAENLAYIIYTSGSTGKPKGVLLPHAALVNHNLAMSAELGLQPTDRVMQFASLGFDVAAEEIFPTLLSGATLILNPSPIMPSILDFLKYIREKEVTLLNLPTPYWHEWVHALTHTEMPPSLRLLVIGSERASPELLALWKRQVTLPLMNAYGLTETTITSLVYHVPEQRDWSGELPLGRPIANVSAYILDEQRQPVADGEEGELYIGGAGLARGYLNRPDLTAERFIPNPANPNERLYRTGDLARYRPDGVIEFRGRADFQVKLRGYRIELEEIEAVLAQHAAVRQALVILREDIPGDKRLVAYVVTQGENPAPSEWRQFLQGKLPAYMVPSTFMVLERLPLTSSGKVDRRALPAPASAALTSDAAYVAPRTKAETALLTIWQEVLGVKQLGIRDNFFELGGNSLLAIRIFSRIERQFDKRLPLGILFQTPTIEQLAAIVESDTLQQVWSPLVTIQEGGAKPAFFCVGGGVINMRNLSYYLGEKQPFYGLQVESLDGKQAMHSSIEEMAAFFVEAVRSHQPQGPYYLGGSFNSGFIALEMARQLKAQGEEIAFLITFNTLTSRHAATTVQTPLLLRFLRKIRKLAKLNPFKASAKEINWDHVRELGMETFWKIAFKFYNQTGRPLPQYLRAGEYVEYLLQRAVERYEPNALYEGDMVTFVGTEWVDRYANVDDPKLGWGDFVAGEVGLHIVPGDPCTMLNEPNVPIVGQELWRVLDKAQARYQQLFGWIAVGVNVWAESGLSFLPL